MPYLLVTCHPDPQELDVSKAVASLEGAFAECQETATLHLYRMLDKTTAIIVKDKTNSTEIKARAVTTVQIVTLCRW